MTTIQIENLGKRYRLGEIGRRSFLTDWKRKLLRQPEPEEGPDTFWALRDLTLDIEQGQVVGVIGQNGAGKSTLLKILSSITSPTRGAVRLRGRVASLLEVGTGFHQELNGRDNVYLNGAILGMTRREVAAKFDEIVAFAEMAQFIDTPVKRYSSGMRVRLAFAVAAHLEPEILIVDEVLAVGDAAFQQRCVGKMGEVSRGGRTVLFVSHNAAAVENLCTRGIVLHRGRMQFDGTQTDALKFYARSQPAEAGQLDDSRRTGTGQVRVHRIELVDREGQPRASVPAGDALELRFYYRTEAGGPPPTVDCTLTICTSLGAAISTHSTRFTGEQFSNAPPEGCFVCRLARLPLAAGTYRLDYSIHEPRRPRFAYDAMVHAREIVVGEADFFGGGKLPVAGEGPLLIEGSWSVEPA